MRKGFREFGIVFNPLVDVDMVGYFLFQDFGRSIGVSEVPGDQHDGFFQGFDLPGQHLVVGVSGDEDDEVEVPVHTEFEGLQGIPDIDSFFVSFSVFQVVNPLVMEDDVVFYQGIFEPAVTLYGVVFFCALGVVTAFEIVDFREDAGFFFLAVMLRNTGPDVVEQVDEVDLFPRGKALADFAEIATVDEEADGVYFGG